MTSSNALTVKLLNKSYEIKCSENEVESLQQAADKLNGHLLANKKKFKQLDDLQIFLLAALTISHELIHCQREQKEQHQQVTQLINSLGKKINRAAPADLEKS